MWCGMSSSGSLLGGGKACVIRENESHWSCEFHSKIPTDDLLTDLCRRRWKIIKLVVFRTWFDDAMSYGAKECFLIRRVWEKISKLQKAICWNLIFQISREFYSSPSALILCSLIRKQLSQSFHAPVSRKTGTDVTCPRWHLVPCRDLRFPHSDPAGGK